MKLIQVATTVVIFVASTTVGHASTPAQTFDLNYSGNIAYHNDVIEIPFSIPVSASVRVWTDSFQSGTNFDPIVAIWNMSTDKLVGQNDDNPYLAPGQTYHDSGLFFNNLGAGPYLMTITASDNFASGTSLSSGFSLNHESPIPMNNWCQRANHCGMGTHWQAHVAGVVAGVVPEPESYAMLLAGIGLLGFVARRRLVY